MAQSKAQYRYTYFYHYTMYRLEQDSASCGGQLRVSMHYRYLGFAPINHRGLRA